MPRLQRLTPELASEIVSGVRAGGFPQVAAEAAGVSREQFADWMRLANRKVGKVAPYRNLAAAIRQAQAQARLTAEIAVFKDDPLQWLKSGPGKERMDAAGWSTPAKPQIATQVPTVNLLLNPQFASIIGTILGQLAPYPEAREQVGHALATLDFDQYREPRPVETTGPETTAPASP